MSGVAELTLTKVMQRIRMRLNKHEAPKPGQVVFILEILARQEVARLALTKLLLGNLDIFIRVLQEYNPDEHCNNFCLVLKLLRTLCRIGGQAARGRRGVRAAPGSAGTDIGHEHEHGSQGQGAEELDANGYRLQGVRERLLAAGLVEIVTDAILCSRSCIVHRGAASFLSDMATEEQVCAHALPQALLRLISSSRRACKKIALTLFSTICSNASAKLTLLQAAAAPASREWVVKLLPHMWRIMLDGTGLSLQVQGVEALVQLFVTLSGTEVGSTIAYGLAALLVMDTDREGREILKSTKYIIAAADVKEVEGEESGVDALPAGEQGYADPGAVASSIARVLLRVIEEVQAGASDNESALLPLRERGVQDAIYLCLLRNAKTEEEERAHLSLLQENFAARRTETPAALYHAIVQQEAIVRAQESLQEMLLATLHAWYNADCEMAWNVRILMQKHGLGIDSFAGLVGAEMETGHPAEPGETGSTHVHVQQSHATVDLGVPLRDSVAGDALLAELLPSLQLGMRRGAMKRNLDDTTKEEKENHLVDIAMRYEPAVSPRVISPRSENIDASTTPSAHGSQSGVLGYLLLKKMYGRHGILSVRTQKDDCAVELATRVPSDMNLLRAKPATTANEGTPATDEELARTLQLMGRLPAGDPREEAPSPRRGQGRGRGRDTDFRSQAAKKNSVVAVPADRADSPRARPPNDNKPNRRAAKPGRRVQDKGRKSPPLNSAATAAVAPYSLEILQALADGVNTTYVTQPGHPTAQAADLSLSAKSPPPPDRLCLPHPAAATRPWSGHGSGHAADSDQGFGSSLLEEPSPFVEQLLDVYLNNMREKAPMPSVRDALKQQQGQQGGQLKSRPPGDSAPCKGPVLRQIKIVRSEKM